MNMKPARGTIFAGTLFAIGTCAFCTSESDKVRQPLDSCICQQENKEITLFPNETPCITWQRGHEEEWNWKQGTCQDGLCILTEVPFGCTGQKIPNVSRPLGCTFVCTIESTGETAFGYFPAGTPCNHYVNESYVEGVCQSNGARTLCRKQA
uniref:Putative secreted protein n=1 Tax=Amblyomma tuberculatum TaxID=48802 RepID=A0A6M2E3L7_9ACAR